MTAGVLGEHSGVVIGFPISVKLGDYDVQELSGKEQRGRQTQRRAVDHGASSITIGGHVLWQERDEPIRLGRVR